MRLLSHNFLHSTSRKIPEGESGFPLQLKPTAFVWEPTDTNLEMLCGTWERVIWKCLQGAVESITKSVADGEVELPSALPDTKPTTNELAADETLAETIWMWLMCVHTTDGDLICPATERVFQIKDGIPNMILHEDEV